MPELLAPAGQPEWIPAFAGMTADGVGDGGDDVRKAGIAF